MKLLLVEDDPPTARYLKRGLSEAGFVVDVCGNGEDGLAALCQADYELLVLDIMLPGADGWTVLSELRRSGSGIPILKVYRQKDPATGSVANSRSGIHAKQFVEESYFVCDTGP